MKDYKRVEDLAVEIGKAAGTVGEEWDRDAVASLLAAIGTHAIPHANAITITTAGGLGVALFWDEMDGGWIVI